MKTLLLLRHAEAEKVSSFVDIHRAMLNRALTKIGRAEAQAIGTFIKKKRIGFDLVLCSIAVRARETIELALAAAGLQANVRYEERIYDEGPLRLSEVISEVEDDMNTILLVGHNPGLESLIQLLTGHSASMTTGALAKIVVPVADWRSATEDKSATFDWIVRPEEVVAN